ncbi:MAG: LysM peptidoglycan-binding domain-containing protein [Anaerolineales bacterium]|nr:LysM peptidoglycan-binding domain-containing protein [Anaerolineales bacterium]
MQNARGFGNALIAVAFSILLTLGALSISLLGFSPEKPPAPTTTPILSPIPITATNTLFFVAADTATSTPPFTAVSCQPPVGWIAVGIQAGDTLDSLAAKYRVDKESLKSGNCLFSENLIVGTLLYVPSASPTSTVAACIQGAAGWIKNYIVIAGDTFYNIGLRYGVGANLLKLVNCRVSDQIYVGEALYVPNVPTRTLTFTPQPGITYTPAPLLTEPLTQTVIPFTATFTPTAPPPTSAPSETSAPTLPPTPTFLPSEPAVPPTATTASP